MRWKFLSLMLLNMLGLIAFQTQSVWMPYFTPSVVEEVEAPTPSAPFEQVLLSAQAQKNLNLKAKPLKLEDFWKTVSVPGTIVDRPGASDRGVVVPVTGIITRIHHLPGDAVQPGDELFSVRILSEPLHQAQTELFKAGQDLKLVEEQRKRLAKSEGVIPESRMIEVENQINRLQTVIRAYRLDLSNRGLLPEQIDSAKDGKFLTEIVVRVPNSALLEQEKSNRDSLNQARLVSEIQELKVELGQQVLAGQTLCLLSNHQLLAIEGRAFRDETGLLENAVKSDDAIEVDFLEDPQAGWGKFNQPMRIRYISNTIDSATRTFTFLIPFENEAKSIDQAGHPLQLWRFRPGHPVRLNLKVERLEKVFVLPPEAVVREGGNAYVFRQNGDVFDRKPVQVLYQDRTHIIVANDGSVPAGIYIAQSGALQLNRMIKAQSGTTPKGFHIHADGSVHMGSHE
jgi:membrane fusion protein, heavy metal efflux system